jgi:thiamine-phosphate pyrophosphorylase
MLLLGEDLREATRDAGALFFVNDRLDVAIAAGADGVHLGDDDLPVAIARRLAPRPFLIGRSVDNAEQAVAAVAEGADYVGFGPIYPTAAKSDTGAVVGPDGLVPVRHAVGVPIVAIGGIAPGRAAPAIRAGANGVAVISAITLSQDPLTAARNLSEEIRHELGRHRAS